MFFSLIVLLAAAAVPAQQSPAPKAGPLVNVEFRAITAAGSPVFDLKAADVTLKVDGRERAIRAFDLLRLGDDSAGPARAEIAAPFATNTPNLGGPRDTLLVIDDESIAPGDEKRIALALDQYLSGLGAADRVGLLTVQDRGLNVSLSNDHAVIRKAMAATTGRASSAESADDAACRTRRDLGALISIAGNFPPEGSPVTVLFFSTGLTPPGTATISNMSKSSATSTNMCEVMPRDYQQFERATLASALNIYVVAAALAPSPTLQTGIENLAGLSGNAMVQLVKGGDSDMVRVARENAAWYRMSFEPDMAERNGSTKRVEVQMKRSGVDAHVRPQVVIPKVDMAAFNAQPSVKDMLREARIRRDFQFRAAAFASRETGSDKVKLLVLFEPVESSVVVKSAIVGLYDSKGKLTVQGTGEAANLGRTPSMIAVLASPGVYRMRVAAVDASGRAGTVDSEINVSLTRADPLQLGTLVLGVSDAGSFAGRLSFSTESAAISYLEVYGAAVTGQLSAVVEIAESETGPSLADGSTKVLGDGADGHRVILGGIPITQLRAGDYVVRMVVSLDGKPVGRVVRTLRKNAK